MSANNLKSVLGLKYAAKYPKFLLFFITVMLAYIIFSGKTNTAFHNFLISIGYFGTFVSGILFAYGFTAAPATAVFLILAKEQSIVLAGLIGGLGALLGDLFIFQFVRASFADEMKHLRQEKIVKYMYNGTPKIFKKYLITVFAGFIIASPLPDEIGVALLAASQHISAKIFSLISYALNTAGIFVILYIGKMAL